MHNWDDLRVFLAVARHKSYERAAVAIGLDATTIARRISRLEAALKCTLMERGAKGRVLTAAGRQLLESASSVEVANEQLVEDVVRSSGGGHVRISTSEGFGTAILAPAIPLLLAERAPVSIELVATPGFLSAATREADIAVTLSRPDDKRLAVEKLTDYRLGLYASKEYLAKTGAPADVEALRRLSLVGYVDDLLYADELRYWDEILTGLRPEASSSSIRAQLEIVAAGGGIAVLPCFMVDGAFANLTRVLPRKVAVTRSFWLCVRRDLQQTARIRRVSAWIKDAVARNRGRILPAV